MNIMNRVFESLSCNGSRLAGSTAIVNRDAMREHADLIAIYDARDVVPPVARQPRQRSATPCPAAISRPVF